MPPRWPPGKRNCPQPATAIAARGWWDGGPKGDSRAVLLEWNSDSAATQAEFFPDASESFEIQPATERVPTDPGKIRLRKEVKKLSGDWPKEISGVLVQGSGDQATSFEVKLALTTDRALVPAGPSLSPGLPPVANPASLGRMLLYAFIGGLILNVMPCVLPVIALKILGFVGQSKSAPGRVRALGLIYALGVLVSFAVLAGLVIAVKAAGRQAGWGMQFGNPQFLVILTVLVTLVALNLFGLFEVSLSGRVMGTAGTLATQHGPAGAFFNGGPGHRPGHALHGALPGCRPGLRLCSASGHDCPHLPDGRPRIGFTLRCLELAAGLAEIPP